MTIRMNEQEVIEIVEALAWTGSVVAMLIIGLLVYLMVRPPRRRRDERRREAETETLDAEQVLAVLDRMERRLEVLERAVPAEARDEERFLEAGTEGPKTRRSK